MMRLTLLAAALWLSPTLVACTSPVADEPAPPAGPEVAVGATNLGEPGAEPPLPPEDGTSPIPGAAEVPSGAALSNPGSAPSLENLVLPSRHAADGTVVLMGGQAEEPIIEGAPSTLLVRMSHVAAMGDFDRDGSLDMAVVLISMPGASASYYDLYVVLNEETGPRALEPVALGDRVQPQSVVASGEGLITVNYLDRSPDEPSSAAPTVPVQRLFAVYGGELVEMGSPGATGATAGTPTPTP